MQQHRLHSKSKAAPSKEDASLCPGTCVREEKRVRGWTCRVLLVTTLISVCARTGNAAAGHAPAAKGDGEATALIYDTVGVYPQCSEGAATFMEECVLPADYRSYFLSADPALTTSHRTCEALGFDFVATDPTFGYKLYWRGGRVAFDNFTESFGVGHPQVLAFLNASRDKNPACASGGVSHVGPHAAPSTTTAPSMAAAAAAAAALTTSAHRRLAFAGNTTTYYDSSGHLPQCSEAPTDYMVNCVHSCDMVAYLLSKTPTLLPGSRCEAMGFEFQCIDNLYPEVRLYWSPNASTTMPDYFGKYFKNHSSAFAFLNRTRDATPACKPAL